MSVLRISQVACLVAAVMSLGGFCVAEETSAEQQAKDTLIVETVLRISNFDLNSSEKGKAAVLRFLAANPGTPRYFELIERFEIADASDGLVNLATQNPSETSGVKAAGLLFKFEQQPLLQKAVAPKRPGADKLVTAIGNVGNKAAIAFLLPLVTSQDQTPEVRNAAAMGLGKNTLGQRELLAIVSAGKLPRDLQLPVAGILHGSSDEKIRAEVGKYLQLPKTMDSKPLPPLPKLIAMKGDSSNGSKLFRTKGTCINCHKIGDEGKEVGPALTEIGSKLSRQAFWVAILDPSAGVSHNYETHTLLTDEGNVITGIINSQTDDAIIITTADAVVRTIPRDEIDEMQKQKISMMPSNMQQLLDAQQLADVVEYLSTLKK